MPQCNVDIDDVLQRGRSTFKPGETAIGGFAEARYGTLQATQIAKSSDVVLTIGAGFKQHATLTSMPASKHIQVEADASEINKHGLADVAVLGDAARPILGVRRERSEALAELGRRYRTGAHR